MNLCHAFTSSFNHSNPSSTLTFQTDHFRIPKIKIKTMIFSELLSFNNQTKRPRNCIKDNFNYLIILMTILVFFCTT